MANFAGLSSLGQLAGNGGGGVVKKQEAGKGTMLNPYDTGFYRDAGGKYINAQTGQVMSEEGYNNMVSSQQAQTAKDAVAAKNAKDMAKQGLNPDGSPIRSGWDGLVDHTTGQLASQYQMNLKDYDPTQGAGFSKYREEALRSGPSVWAQLQNQQQDLASEQAKSAAARQALSGMNQGNQNLAMHGGLSAGAMGLSARSSGRDLLMARQNAALENQKNKLGIATTDEGNRIGQLANLANTENQVGQYNSTNQAKQQEYNIGNLLKENDQKRAYNDLTYTEQMKKWAAGKTADATAKSASGGGKK